MNKDVITQRCRQPAFWLNGVPKRIYDAVQARGGDLRAVGGAVRDYLLQGEPHDFAKNAEIDFACDLSPAELKQVAEDLSAEVRLHGQAYGMIMFIIDGGYYEVTSLRRDVKTFGRSAEVEFGGDWKSDAERRDFTINAMSMDNEGLVYDYFTGLEDLQLETRTPLLRFVGDGDIRIREDYLRILRLFRFYGALKGAKLQDGVVDLCVKHKEALLGLSVERRRDELLGLLSGVQYRMALELLCDSGILAALGLGDRLPELEVEIEGDELVNFHLLYFSGGDFDSFGKDWCLDNVRCRLFGQVGRVLALLGSEDLDYLLHCYGVGVVRLAVLLGGFYDLWGRVVNWEEVAFPVSGGDIIGVFGVSGAEVGDYLDRGLRFWLRGGRVLGKGGVLDYLGGG